MIHCRVLIHTIPSTLSHTDWRRLTQVLLKDSASPSLAACAELAGAHEALGKKLFVAAFVSCWSEISTSNQVQRAGPCS